jgi:hypothetical protein
MLEKDKHGILLFDAVSLRKSLAVNSENLTYLGLENFRNDFGNNFCHKVIILFLIIYILHFLSKSMYILY